MFISILCYLNLFDVDVPWLCVALKIGDPQILHPVAVRLQCRAHLCYLLHLIKKSCFLPGGFITGLLG